MPSWYIKAAIQGTLSLLPGSKNLNYFFQRHVSKGLRLNERFFRARASSFKRHWLNYKEFRGGVPHTVAELGTGWHPIVPVCFFLSGVERVISIDINPHLRDNLVRETLTQILVLADEGQLAELVPDLQPERLQHLRQVLDQRATMDAKRLLGALQIDIRVADAQTADLPPIDLFVSNNTLEHVPGPVIEGIFHNLRQYLLPAGLMSHLIDISDHYAHFDSTISRYNYLKFSPEIWRIFNNELHYQSRLRISDYRALHTTTGYEILHEDSHPLDAPELHQINIHPDFRAYTHEDLSVTSAWIVARPTPA